MSKLITRVLGHRIEIEVDDKGKTTTVESSLDGEVHYGRRMYKGKAETIGDHLVWAASDAIAKEYDANETEVFSLLLEHVIETTNTRISDLYLLAWDFRDWSSNAST